MIPFRIIGLLCILPLMLCGKKEVGCWIGVGLPGVENDTCAGHSENGCLCLDLSGMSFLCCSFYLSKKDLFVSQFISAALSDYYKKSVDKEQIGAFNWKATVASLKLGFYLESSNSGLKNSSAIKSLPTDSRLANGN